MCSVVATKPNHYRVYVCSLCVCLHVSLFVSVCGQDLVKGCVCLYLCVWSWLCDCCVCMYLCVWSWLCDGCVCVCMCVCICVCGQDLVMACVCVWLYLCVVRTWWWVLMRPVKRSKITSNILLLCCKTKTSWPATKFDWFCCTSYRKEVTHIASNTSPPLSMIRLLAYLLCSMFCYILFLASFNCDSH